MTEIQGLCSAFEATGITIKQLNGDEFVLELPFHGDLTAARKRYLNKMVGIRYTKSEAGLTDFKMGLLHPKEPEKKSEAIQEKKMDPEVKKEGKLELIEIKRLIPITDRPLDMMEVTISIPKSMSTEELDDWWTKFLKAGFGQLLLNKPEIFKAKDGHDWTHPTIMGIKLREKYQATYQEFQITPDNRIPRQYRHKYMTQAFDLVVKAIGGMAYMAGALEMDKREKARHLQEMVQGIAHTYYCHEIRKQDMTAELAQIAMLKTASQRTSLEIPIPATPTQVPASKKKNEA
jgi:hypothetical protein